MDRAIGEVPATWREIGERLTPDRGWRYRTRTMDQEMTAELGGKVKVVTDDLRNVFSLAPDALNKE